MDHELPTFFSGYKAEAWTIRNSPRCQELEVRGGIGITRFGSPCQGQACCSCLSQLLEFFCFLSLNKMAHKFLGI